MRRLPTLLLVAGLASGCARPAADAAPAAPGDGLTRAQRLEALLDTLADDSMMGRRVGTEGIHAAASFLASELARAGVDPAGDDGYLQHVPVARTSRRGRPGFVIPSASVDFDTLPAADVLHDEANVVGVIPGSDEALSREVVVIGAHYDHLGVGPPVDGDSIYNGADDDGSGTVAVLDIARDLVRGPRPRRTVVVLLSTGEEVGMLGTRWYLEHPVEPLERTVADFQIEMIGRPDSLAGGPGRAWLTGYERTTMGDQLSGAGSPIVPDPRPDQRFFFRSDNAPFALAGIPAHTLSSFNLHTDYHRPSDEVGRVDFRHLAAVVDAAVQAVRFLADGPKPRWKEGGRVGLEGR
jgi:Peptidase family M28